MIELRCSRPGGCLCGKPLSGCINAEFVVRPGVDPLRAATAEAVETLDRLIREQRWLMTDGALTTLIHMRNKLKEALKDDR